jgi:hypothetical protein
VRAASRRVDVPLGEAVQQLVERDPALEAGEARAQAEVDAVAERQVRDVVAVDVEHVGIGVATRVTVRRRRDHQDRVPGRDGRALDLDVLGHPASGGVAGRLEPQRLVDDAGDERAVLHDLASLVGVIGEDLGEPADEPARGLVSGAGQHGGVGEDLLSGELSRLAVLVLELGVQQHRHEVVGRMLGAPLDVLGEHRAAGDVLLAHRHRLAGHGAQVGVGLVAHRDLVLFGDPEEHADHPHRQRRGELGDDVEAVGADERIEAGDAVRPDMVFELGHATGGEHPRQEPSVCGVDRRVLEHDHARRQLDVGLHDVEDVAAGAREHLPVPEGLLDIGVA